MTTVKCPHCAIETEINKTWIKEGIGVFTYCNKCKTGFMIGPLPEKINVMEEPGITGTRECVDNPRRVSAIEMRRRLDDRIGKNRDE